MSARKKVNKDHPDFAVYLAKCYALTARYNAEEDRIEKAGMEKHPDWAKKMYAPWEREVGRLRKRFNAELKELQKEYDYLFSELDSQDEQAEQKAVDEEIDKGWRDD